jgi:hypothetical protein
MCRPPENPQEREKDKNNQEETTDTGTTYWEGEPVSVEEFVKLVRYSQRSS